MSRIGRNPQIGRHVGKYGRNALIRKKAVYKRYASFKNTPAAAEQTPETKEVKVKGAKNGEKRIVPTTKAPRFYPAEDVRQLKASRKTVGVARLRATITPGTVLILLAGKYRGRRVVFLRQLESGLLLVSGPAKLNSVPLRRVNQAYVIATSTKIDISSIAVPETLNDAYFKRVTSSRVQGTEGEFFKKADEKASKQKENRTGDHKSIDKELIAQIQKVPELAKYLATPFALSNGQYPHLLNF